MIYGTFDFLRRRLLRRGDLKINSPLDFKTKFVLGPLAALADGAAADGVGPLAAVLVACNVIGDSARAPDAEVFFALTHESHACLAL